MTRYTDTTGATPKNLHFNLEEDQKHTPQGFSTASNNSVPTRDEQGALIWDERMTVPAALSFANASLAPPTENDGDIYVLVDSSAVEAGWDGASENDWVRYDADSSAWFGITPIDGTQCFDKTASEYKVFSGGAWSSLGGGDNFATADLTLTGDRTHDLDSNNLTFQINPSQSLSLNGFSGVLENSGSIKTYGSNSTITARNATNTWDVASLKTAGTGNAGALSLSYNGNDYFNINITNGIEMSRYLNPTVKTFRINPVQSNYLQIQDIVNSNTWYFHNNGSFSVGANDNSARLFVQGQGATNATTAFLVENSSATQLLKIDDAGGFALGSGATYADSSNVSIGLNASASVVNAVSIGISSSASVGNSVALGASANVTGSGGVAIGRNSDALNAQTIALGEGATATGNNNISMGAFSSSNSVYGMAIGRYANCTGGIATAIGSEANVTGLRSLSIGNKAIVSGSYSILLSASPNSVTNSTSNSFEVNLNNTTSVFRFGNTVDGWLNSTGGFVFGATTVNASAALQVDSTTKGFLPPRMTTTEKNAITTPATGLVVFDTTLAKLCVYTGAAWETITSA